MAPGKARTRARLVTALKAALVALVLWGLHRTIRSALADLEGQHWRPSELRVGWLVVSGVAYLAGQLPSSLFWRRLLATLDAPAPALAAVRAWYVGSIGKYVPGKATVIVLRTALLRRAGVGIAVATATIFFETLTTMAVGAFLAGGILVVAYRDRWQLAAMAGGLMLVAGAPTVPAIFKRLAKWAGIERAAPGTIDKLDHLGPATLVRAWATIAAGWCLIGASVVAGLLAIEPAPPGGRLALWALATAAGGLSVVAGFVSFIPGGLVVRDAVMLELLAPEVGTGKALVCALVVRLVWLVSEAAISTILYFSVRPTSSGVDATP
ncbi:MAG: flippase-like domain-containing protein [Planctomycetia bacterium]|nr:flippase-like domain-containing protein [Planctomycetia bacterium]